MYYPKMWKHPIFILTVQIVLKCTTIHCDILALFKKIENVDKQICMDTDSVFSMIQIFDKSFCLHQCVSYSGCRSVFHGQYTGDCIGCVASFDISNQPTGTVDNLQYYWQPNCPGGWSDFANSCYLMTENRMNFLTGAALCQSMNARAVIIDSEGENNYLKTLIRSTMTYTDDDYTVFTGFTDMYIEGVWVEYGTSNQMTFMDWYNSQPDNWEPHENCLALFYPYDLAWADVPCSWEGRIICEKN